MSMPHPALAAVAIAVMASSAQASSHGNDLVHARKFNGTVYMMNAGHMSLYTYAKDKPGTSNCTGTCARNWPPLVLPAGSELGENYSLIQRQDGRMQVTYKGMPLYLYSGDKKVGDTTGDGLGGVWKLAKPF